MPIVYDDIRFDEAFRSDMVVNGKLSRNSILWKRCFPFTRNSFLLSCLSGLKLGLLVNFGEAHLKNGIKRIINGELDDENSPETSL